MEEIAYLRYALGDLQLRQELSEKISEKAKRIMFEAVSEREPLPCWVEPEDAVQSPPLLVIIQRINWNLFNYFSQNHGSIRTGPAVFTISTMPNWRELCQMRQVVLGPREIIVGRRTERKR